MGASGMTHVHCDSNPPVHWKVTSEVKVPRPEGGAGRRSSLDLPREKNVLFPSGSNTVNRGELCRFTAKVHKERKLSSWDSNPGLS